MESHARNGGSESGMAESSTAKRTVKKYGKNAMKRKKTIPTTSTSPPLSPPPVPQLESYELLLGTSSTPTPSDLNTNQNRNTATVDDSFLDDLSDLTSLSSDDRPPSPDSDIVIVEPTEIATLPKPFPLLEGSMSKDPLFKGKGPALNLTTLEASTPTSSRPRKKPYSPASDLDTYVWVLITPETMGLFDQRKDRGKGLWWPGKILRPHLKDPPIDVKLFGKNSITIQINSPSKEIILPQPILSTKLKFSNPSFVSSRQNQDRTLPRKKRKNEQDETRTLWKAAADEMKLEMQQPNPTDGISDILSLTDTDDEDLPLYVKPVSSFSHSMSAAPKISAPKTASKAGKNSIRANKRKRGINDSDNSSADIEEVPLLYEKVDQADEPDSELNIPGELILARASKDKSAFYWPAKIESYTPPSKPKQTGKYKVTFLDATTLDIPRDWFYILTEREFGLCKLGTFQSNEPQNLEDSENDEEVEDNQSSPEPEDPPPLKEEFRKLPIEEQFIYTKGVLRAILEDRYEPSRQKHDDFVKGGKLRKKVTNGALLRGLMNAKEVEYLHKLVAHWCLKNLVDDLSRIDESSPEPINGEDTQRGKTGTETTSAAVSEPVVQGPIILDSVMQDVSGVNDPPENVEPDEVVDSSASMPRFRDYIHPESAIRFGSPSPMESSTSSPPPSLPPSSYPDSEIELASSQSVAVLSPPLSSFASSVFAGEPSLGNGSIGDMSDLTAMEEEEDRNVDLDASKTRRFVPFSSLIDVDKIEYCSNVLVPEAIRQILLWRSGDRSQINLLSPQEEYLLYEKGQTLLSERDWVFDVMRLRESKCRSILEEQKTVSGRHRRNGGSSRPQRNTVYNRPNYAE